MHEPGQSPQPEQGELSQGKPGQGEPGQAQRSDPAADLLDAVVTEAARGPVALARVVTTSGSSPRAAGAAMLVTADGRVFGSLSGGCVESAVVEAARTVLDNGTASTEYFADTGDDLFAIGLTCGGEIEVFIESIGPDDVALFAELRALRAADIGVALATTMTSRPHRRLFTRDDATRWLSLDRDVQALLSSGVTGVVGADDCEPDALGAGGPGSRPRTFVQSFTSAPRMILAGANDFVRALAQMGTAVGYRVTVVDAREVFATATRFPGVQVVVDWPHRYLQAQQEAGRLDERTVVVVMTHDAKFDVPMIAAALAVDELAFVGAMGSRRTQADRRARLVDHGVDPAALGRLHAPVGLDLQAHSPAETAVSILAEIIATVRGGSTAALGELTGPLHTGLGPRNVLGPRTEQ
ncbi:XdhC family protein [Gordonia jinhuaensis]|uniref:Xanthine dehydrogenase accessory factor n=1 Tax=Gordonia jinhuaensis TaxID=1517702 RepID=A0A916WS29_9ACTN|nr:hypothetical protein GCM10011489_16780 [Gordonia jinhuaensis]